MRISHSRWTVLAAVHLALVIAGAGQWLPEQRGGRWVQALRWYATMSGANSQFGFYAPEVGDHCRARFVLQNARGDTWTDSFHERISPEVQLRLVGTAEAAFANGAAREAPARRERLVRSWAAAMFTRHPDAVTLMVVVEAYIVPTRADYRAGSRPTWKCIYQAQVQREAHAVQTGVKP